MTARRSRTPLRAAAGLLAGVLILASPSAAPAAGDVPEPLVDRQPATTAFEDRVLPATPAGARARAAARQDRDALRITTGDGHTVQVSFAAPFEPDRAVARTYVAFLQSLPHGDELGRLSIVIARPRDVGPICRGGRDVLACYSPGAELMVVPGGEIGSPRTPTTSYVVAHEYGHHVAHNRSNDPFPAIDYGPKHWASHERVCAQARAGLLAPGDEGSSYRLNPGESWAEVYARLTYPDLPWRFTELLAPDAGALAAARRDVLDPWTGPRTRTFTLRGARRARTFRLPIGLDGALRARVAGPAGSDVALRVSSNGTRHGATRGRGSSRSIGFEAACRDRDRERVAFRVVRRAGRGPVTLRVTYAG